MYRKPILRFGQPGFELYGSKGFGSETNELIGPWLDGKNVALARKPGLSLGYQIKRTST